jgi:Rieske 2Fe-2S family protein
MTTRGSSRERLPERVEELIRSRRDGYALDGPFYLDDEVYRADIERIWLRGWLFAGLSCELPRAGDYLVVELDRESVIVVRGEDGAVRGLHNTCRHRGTRLCSEPAGRVRRFVCPYHQWVYELDGSLLSCSGMHHGVERGELGLKRAAVEELEGVIFVSMSPEPLPFAPAAQCLGPALHPQGLVRARVAKAIDYTVAANWKLVWENNRECYHCVANHPQYVRANFDHYDADDTSGRVRKELEQAVRRSEAKWAARGLSVTHHESGMTRFPEKSWFSANRTALVEGYVSESMDGRQVAPLMGVYTDPDVGTLRIRTLPNMWCHASCDHAVFTRLLPRSISSTWIRVIWLVDEGAVEGRDYRLEALLPFWQLTSEQDWELCVRAQDGVSSRAYTPGPFSADKEYNVEGFVRWYLRQLRGGEE